MKTLDAVTIPEFTEEQYIQLYDKVGCAYFCKGDDAQLREWGNSEERIREIKVESVKSSLQFGSDGVKFFIMLNEIKAADIKNETGRNFKYDRKAFMGELAEAIMDVAAITSELELPDVHATRTANGFTIKMDISYVTPKTN